MSPGDGAGYVCPAVHPVIFVCIALVVVGIALALRWGGRPFLWPPTTQDEVGRGERALRALWYLDVHVVAAIATGLLVIGPGGRLAMRLLAVTAGDAAQGRVTEAEETVGRITVDGTIGLVLFVGLFGGLLVAIVAGALRPWLPAGRLSALCVGAALLLTGATRNDPLRPENPDFVIVGPSWLAIAVFVALIIAATLTFEAIAARTARSLPIADGRRPVTLLPYAPLALLGLTGALPIALLVAAAAVFLGSIPLLRRWWQGPIRTIGQLVLAVAAVVLTPLLVGDLWSIAAA